MPLIINDVMIEIPIPRPTQNLNRGYLRPVPKTRPSTIRYTDDDREHVKRCAHSLGMSFGEFTRWCSVYTAIAVNNMIAAKEYEERKPKEIDTSDYK